MLEDFLSDIYEKAMAIELLKETSFYSNLRQQYVCCDLWNEAMIPLKKFLQDLKDKTPERYNRLLSVILETQEYINDNVRFASLIDTDIIPLLCEYMKNFTGIEVDDGRWTLSSSQTGFLTLKNNDGFFVHNPSDPMWESFLYANNIYKPQIVRYNILGSGLGYLAYQLWRLSEGYAEIYVYETDEIISTYADLYGVISMINNGKIHYITAPDEDAVIERFFEDIDSAETCRTVYYWDENAYKGKYAESISAFINGELTTRVFGDKFLRNYTLNMTLDHQYVDDLKAEYIKEEWVIVAAGPSLNDNQDFIKESVGNRTICAINASLKWFSVNGIKPDLCTACDPNKSLIPHIESLVEFSKDIPLIADCSTNHGYMELYAGPKYYVISDESPQPEENNDAKRSIWSFGGTVTSMALEAAFRFGAKKIYLIGADLAYPGKQSYAEGVGHDNVVFNGNDHLVISVEDTLIPTSDIFSEYILQIEKQISEHSDVKVINRSLHGAYLQGTYCNCWWEKMPESESFSDYLNYLERLKDDSHILGWREKYYIFRQTMTMVESKKIILNPEEETSVKDVYNLILYSFKQEMGDLSFADGKVDNSSEYIIIDEFPNTNASYTKKALELAKNLTGKRKNTLIINTFEKIGGEKVPIHNVVDLQYNKEMETKEKVFYGNLSIPYYQFPEGMPDVNYYLAFIESLGRRKPGKIYSYSKYSLFADACREMLKLPVEVF